MSASVDCAVRVKSQDTMSGKAPAKAGGDGSELLPDFSESLEALSEPAAGDSAQVKNNFPDYALESRKPEDRGPEEQSPSELLAVLTASESGDASLSEKNDVLSALPEKERPVKDDEETDEAPEEEDPAVPADVAMAETASPAQEDLIQPAAAPADIPDTKAVSEGDGFQANGPSGVTDREIRTPDVGVAGKFSEISADKTTAGEQAEDSVSEEIPEDAENSAGVQTYVAQDTAETEDSIRDRTAARRRTQAAADGVNFASAHGAQERNSGIQIPDEPAASRSEPSDSADTALSAGQPASTGTGAADSIYTLLHREFKAKPGAAAQAGQTRDASSGETGGEASAETGETSGYEDSGEQSGEESGTGENKEYPKRDETLLSDSRLRDTGLFSRIIQGADASSAVPGHTAGSSFGGGFDLGALQSAAQVRSAVQGQSQQNPMDVLSRPLLMTDASSRGSGMSERVSAMISRNLSDADIHLSPEGMGRLHIHLEMKDRTHAKVAIIAERQDTAQLLQDTMPKLRESLQGSGITLDGGSGASADAGNSAFGSGRDTGSERGAFRSTFRVQGTGGLRGSGSDDAGLTEAAPEIRIKSGSSGVDYYA
ncbi:MAG: flagellar hook-length control protein FliK [Succinivibrionaceae bacterium]|nr:flagellar hook-length control protein FliK [Succinivibrionaceae bacterium]